MELKMEVRPWGVGDKPERYELLLYPCPTQGDGEEDAISLSIIPVDHEVSDGPWETGIELYLPEAKRLFAELGVMIASLEMGRHE